MSSSSPLPHAQAGPALPVEMCGVTFSYASEATAALQNVDFTVQPDDFVGVIGPNGGGKTTLLKLMLGLLKPQCGSIRVFGSEPSRQRSQIGYVPQHHSIDSAAPASVRDIVLLGRLSRSPWGFRYRRVDRHRAMEALEQTGVQSLADRPIGSLSGGQRQRVLIARSLASDPRLLLLDEPMAGVDEPAQEGLTDLLHRLHQHMPIVIVSHDVGFVSTLVRHVACVNRTLTLHDVADVSDEVIATMYHGDVRAIHHHHHHHDASCPVHDDDMRRPGGRK